MENKVGATCRSGRSRGRAGAQGCLLVHRRAGAQGCSLWVTHGPSLGPGASADATRRSSKRRRANTEKHMHWTCGKRAGPRHEAGPPRPPLNGDLDVQGLARDCVDGCQHVGRQRHLPRLPGEPHAQRAHLGRRRLQAAKGGSGTLPLTLMFLGHSCQRCKELCGLVLGGEGRARQHRLF